MVSVRTQTPGPVAAAPSVTPGALNGWQVLDPPAALAAGPPLLTAGLPLPAVYPRQDREGPNNPKERRRQNQGDLHLSAHATILGSDPAAGPGPDRIAQDGIPRNNPGPTGCPVHAPRQGHRAP